jgi:hypothetical protein
MPNAASALQDHLAALKSLRGPAADAPPRLIELKAWQSARLASAYADLAAQPRYAAATSFFLDDLYGPKDFSGRDAAMLRIVPVMRKLLPESALETAALAIELEALSEALDQRVARALPDGAIDAASYAQAYRAAGSPGERDRQIELILAVGARLDALVKKPLLGRTLKLMRQPARMAGLADLQDFLERGFGAFARMQGSRDFLATLQARESAIADTIFSGRVPAFSASR